MARLSSLAKKLTEQNGTEVVTAVCEIFRNLGKERESVGQGCLVQTKQSNECCVVTADKVIPNGQLDTCEVEFTRGDSKLKRFFLKDIKKNVYYNSGLVIIVIDLESVKKKHKKNTWSMFTKSPLTITALEECKKQICYIGKKRFTLIVSRNSTIKFPDHTPPTIPNGLVILQTASNSTDNDVFAIGIQSQVDGNQKIIWMNKILAGHRSSQGNQDPPASLTTIALSMSEPPNPGSTGDTASNQTPTNGGDQQSLNATAAAHKPGNELQNPVLNNGTAAVDNTDDSHTSPTRNENSADSTVRDVGGADHNFQSTKGVYKPETDQHEAALGHKMFSIGGKEEEVLQAEGNQGSLVAPITAPDPSSIETPNPHTASTQTPANGDGQQSLVGAGAAAAADQPDNAPQNPVLNGGTAAGDVTDVSHTSSSDKEDGADYTTPATGDADHNSQRIEAASWLGRIHGGLPEQENSPTNRSMKEESEHGATGGASDQQAVTVTENFEHYRVSEKIAKDKFLQDKLALHLDHTSHRVIKGWEHLACTREINAPLEVRLRCKLSSRNSCTMMLFGVVAAEGNKTLKDLMDALTERCDVKKIITDVYPDAASSTQDLNEFATKTVNSNILAKIATLLDQESRVYQNWRHLGHQFELSCERLNELEYGQYTQGIMEYLYSAELGLTIGTFYDEVEKLKRHDVLKKLDPFIVVEGDRNKLMRDVIGLESDAMRGICVCLNNPNKALKNWKHLAKSPVLGIPDEVLRGCTPETPKSPTESLFEWIYVERSSLTIGQLCRALERIDRNDVVRDIKECFQHQPTSNQ